jgi:hypothetical protein
MEGGHVEVLKEDSDTPFDDLFAGYKSQIMSTMASKNRRNERLVKSSMAKRSTKQAVGSNQKTTLLA